MATRARRHVENSSRPEKEVRRVAENATEDSYFPVSSVPTRSTSDTTVLRLSYRKVPLLELLLDITGMRDD